MKDTNIGLRLGFAFAFLMAILAGIGQLGLRRMDQVHRALSDINNRQIAKLELARQALELSNRNSRITLQILLLDDEKLSASLLAKRADNTQQISDLVAQLENRCESPEEIRLLGAVKRTRAPYIASYQQALHLALVENKRGAAVEVMVHEALPALLIYHNAWEDFVRYEGNEVDLATRKAAVEHQKARHVMLLLLGLAACVALAISIYATRQTAWEMNRRIGAEKGLSRLNADLEHKVTQRTRELSEANRTMAGEIEERKIAQQKYQEEAVARKAAEAELLRSEERMRMAMTAAKIGCWDWDIVKDEQVWTDMCWALLGLPSGAIANFDVLMGSVHPDDRESLWNEIQQAIEGKRDYAVEFRVIWPDGSMHWSAAMGHAFYDETGRPTRMTGIAMDIDKRRTTEERLRLQAAALEAAANSIVITDRKGNMIWANPAFSALTGYSLQELVGRNPRILKSGKQDEAFYNDLSKTIASGKIWHGEIINRRRDRSIYLEEMTITPVANDKGEITHFIAIKLDVTERKRAEEELRQAEAKYRTIFEDAPIGIYQSTPEGRLLSINPALTRICGYENPEAQLADTKDIAQDWYVDPVRGKEFNALMASQGIVHDFEYQARRKDGKPIWLSQNAHAVRDSQARVRYYEGTVHDITERKSLEAQLRQAQKMEAVGRLAGGVAHDFNNALGVINGYSELLQFALPAESPLRKQAEEIQKAGRRAATLTQQLLAFSRKQVVQPVVLDLNSVVTDIDKMLRRLIGEDISLVLVRDPKLKGVRADRGQIDQVLMNLAVNARDAMPQGGKLAVETANVELDQMYVKQHPYAKAGRYVMLTFSDTGCGMDKETQAHIFEPFFTTKELGKGTGLGLSTVYGIVKQSEGYISVYSELGKGTTFRIYLPQVESAAEASASDSPRKELPRGTETILLVEDEESMLVLTRGCLQTAGYTVLEARDGKAATEVARQHSGPLHLLLTDVVMPGISGRELADTLAKLRPEMKLLFMSGYTNDLLNHHGAISSGTMLLEKPFGIEALLTKVRTVLDGQLAKAAVAQ